MNSVMRCEIAANLWSADDEESAGVDMHHSLVVQVLRWDHMLHHLLHHLLTQLLQGYLKQHKQTISTNCSYK